MENWLWRKLIRIRAVFSYMGAGCHPEVVGGFRTRERWVKASGCDNAAIADRMKKDFHVA
ncbi:MAG: hypothetical protein ABWY08_04630 [Comamonas sp.]